MSSRKIQISVIAAVCVTLVAFTVTHIVVSKPQPSEGEPIAPLDPRTVEQLADARSLQERKQWTEANALFRSLAANGHPVAMYGLARAFKYGWGVPIDLEAARKWYKKSVRFDFVHRGQAAHEIGRLYSRSAGENCDEIAFAWFKKALGWSFDKAHVDLAHHYRHGLGVEQDAQTALHHYKQAAASGEAYATLKFAQWLLTGGDGIERDEERGLYWGRRAIEGLVAKAGTGSGSAAKTLGRLYRDGVFVEASTQEAERWFRLASTTGDNGGMHELAQLLLSASGDESDVQEGLDLLQAASERGHGGAVTMLGRLHLAEQHGLSDTHAVPLFERGIALRHPGSMAELARLLAEGRLIDQDKDRALKLARDGAKLGHDGSRSLLSELQAQMRNQTDETDKS